MLSKPKLPFKYLPHHDRAPGGGGVRDKEPRGPFLESLGNFSGSKSNIQNEI